MGGGLAVAIGWVVAAYDQVPVTLVTRDAYIVPGVIAAVCKHE